MNTYIALFRGINVGGKHMVSMKDLKLLLEKHGCVDARTYIQSGNAVFRSSVADPERLATRLTDAVSRSHGFAPRVLVLTADELQRAVTANPFPDATENPGSLHLFFLFDQPVKPDLKVIEAFRAKSERFALKNRVFYLHTPEGLGTSKLAARGLGLLGVEATARNWRTVTTLIEMARQQ